jgi:membrane associated rhomboid family serine protease
MFFFLLPVGVDYRARRYPVVTFTLMGICTVIYVITFFTRMANGEAAFEWEAENLWLVPALSHWWTYLTSMFVHEGFFHLLGNMVYLFLFGSCVEDILGRWQFTLFYLVGGLVAEFVYLLFSPGGFGSIIPMGGASGAISACIGGFVLLLGKTRIEFKWVFFFLFRLYNGEWFFPAWLVISFWFGSDLLGMIATAMQDEDGGGVAFGAHVGGFLLGLSAIAAVKWLRRNAEEREEAAASLAEEDAAPALEAASFHLSWDGNTYGPFTPTQVRDMFQLGSVPDQAFFWEAGVEGWRGTAELRERLGV